MYLTVTFTGKHDSTDAMEIKCFNSKETAEEYCTENTDDKPEKYWCITYMIKANEMMDITNIRNNHFHS